MRARVRDAIAVAVLLAAGIAIGLAWHPLGPWVSLAMAFAAGLTTLVVYRMPSSMPPLGRQPADEVARLPVLLRQD